MSKDQSYPLDDRLPLAVWLRRVMPGKKTGSRVPRKSITLPVFGARLEINGWHLELRRSPEGVSILLRGTFDEGIAGGSAGPLEILDALDGDGGRITLADCSIGLSDIDWAFDIRTESGQLIGYVGKADLLEYVRAIPA